MSLIKMGAFIARRACLAMPSVSQKEQDDFLEIVRDKVSYYQPKIESKCGVGLGDVRVRNGDDYVSDFILNLSYDRETDNSEEDGRDFSFFNFQMNYLGYSTRFFHRHFLKWVSHSSFNYYNNALYASFNYASRFKDPGFEYRSKYLDYIVVHELSHVLWDNVGDVQGVGDVWDEGFATYCAGRHFSDFYSDKNMIIPDDDLYRVNFIGMKSVEKLVEKYGDNFVLEIPKKWHEFSAR